MTTIRFLETGLFCVLLASAQASQNPSPMVENTRGHPRLEQADPEGRRIPLRAGTLFIPEPLTGRKELPLFVHFHGGTWLPEVAAARVGRLARVRWQIAYEER